MVNQEKRELYKEDTKLVKVIEDLRGNLEKLASKEAGREPLWDWEESCVRTEYVPPPLLILK